MVHKYILIDTAFNRCSRALHLGVVTRGGSRVCQQVGPPGQGPGSEASTLRENTDTHSGKKSVVTSAHPPVLDIRSD